MNLSRLIRAVALCGAIISFNQSSYAAPIVINDDYIGGGATDAGYATADVIGDNNFFGISKMEVDVSAGQLSISVFSSYFNNVGKFGTGLGDLFISQPVYEASLIDAGLRDLLQGALQGRVERVHLFHGALHVRLVQLGETQEL